MLAFAEKTFAVLNWDGGQSESTDDPGGGGNDDFHDIDNDGFRDAGEENTGGGGGIGVGNYSQSSYNTTQTACTLTLNGERTLTINRDRDRTVIANWSPYFRTAEMRPIRGFSIFGPNGTVWHQKSTVTPTESIVVSDDAGGTHGANHQNRAPLGISTLVIHSQPETYCPTDQCRGGVGLQTRGSMTCRARLIVTEDPLPECSDGKDNDDTEDAVEDRQDPGCHTDGNPFDSDIPSSYRPNDNDESNPRPNLVAKAPTKVGSLVGGRTIRIISTVSNTARIYVPANEISMTRRSRVIGGTWGNATEIATVNVSYGPQTTRTLNEYNFPLVAGREYQFCTIADATGRIIESSETDNRACVNYTVPAIPVYAQSSYTPATPSVSLSIRKVGTSNWSSSASIQAGEDVELRWQTLNVDSCAAGIDGNFIVSPDDGSSGQTNDVSEPLSGNRTYTIECLNTTTGNTVTSNASVNVSAPPYVQSGYAPGYSQSSYSTPTGYSQSSYAPLPTTALILTGPSLVRYGTTATLTWDNGNHTGCTLTGNGETVDASSPRHGTHTTTAITGETSYTLRCTDTTETARKTIKVLPVYQES
jgi:hypothetical protein